jgi:hypothetical protein
MDQVDTLCHYTTADTALDHIIPSGRLRMSPYARMRDPLENRELGFAGGSLPLNGTCEDDALAELVDLMDNVERRIRRIRNRMLLLSFTVDATEGYVAKDEPFMRAWARARMWEQYASNHSGACIAFDRDRTLGHLYAQLHALGSPTRDDVVYTPRGFRGTDAANLPLATFRDEESSLPAWVIEHESDLYFTKTLDWQTEHEYRVTVFTDTTSDDGYVYVPFGGSESVRAVILGEHFPQSEVSHAEATCREAGIELLMVVWQRGAPRLVASEYAAYRRPGGGLLIEPFEPEDLLDPNDIRDFD